MVPDSSSRGRRAKDSSRVILTRKPLVLENAIRQVTGPGEGAIITFSGCVRDEEDGFPIGSITYEAYAGMAEKEMKKILRAARERWKAKIVVHHRIGRVPAGEPSLIVACAAAHRKESFEACKFTVDRIKEKVPIWKTGFERKVSLKKKE